MRHEMLGEMRSDYNWKEAFACAMQHVSAVLGYSGSTASFDLNDVAEVIAAAEGQNDEDAWIGAFRLADGRYAFVSAWCDYTGWDCRSGGSAYVAGTAADLIRLGIGDKDRARLGLEVDGQSPVKTAT